MSARNSQYATRITHHVSRFTHHVPHPWLLLILAAFLTLGVTYSIVTPIFEAGDEIWHYPFVQHLATGHGLPIQDPNVETLWKQEGGQPPLYYALSALATFWIDTRDLSERLWRNPHARIGIPLDFGNKNLIVHTSAENFPWRNTALAVHLIRFLSILLSAGTVTLTYWLALEIGNGIVIASAAKQSPIQVGDCFVAQTAPRNDSGNRTLAAFAAAIVAFNPMFLFISASVNNDSLATLLATLALLLLTRLITRGATLRRFVVLGVVLGLGALTKVSLLGLLVVAACVFLYLLWNDWHGRQGDRETRRQGDSSATLSPRHLVTLSPCHLVTHLKLMVLCAIIVVALAFWWYARNWLLYGDLLAFNVWVAIAGGRPTPITLLGLLGEFQGLRISFWGNFGGVNIIAPEWVYIVLDAFTVLAVIGLLIGLARRALPRLLALPALWLALISLALARWTLLTLASQGRLIFPAIAAVAVLVAYGLAQFQGSRLKVRGSRFEVQSFRSQVSRFTFHFLLFTFYFLLFIFALLAPFALIAPTYALPARLPNDASVPNPTHITFDDQAELVGYTLPQKSVAPGDALPLTVYWRARERIAEDFSVYIRLIDANGEAVGRWDAFPGGGLYPTRLWQPGEVIVDAYRVPLSHDARGPAVGRIEAGLFRRVPLENLTARDPQGRVVTPTIARFKIAGQAQVQIENAVRYEFADKIALVGYGVGGGVTPPLPTRAGDTLHARLYWRALAAMNVDYTVFVHLVDAGGKTIAQKDDQPQRGAYPTSFWDAGETIADEYALVIPRDAPPGAYNIVVGIYRAEDGARLAVRGNGDHVVVVEVTVR